MARLGRSFPATLLVRPKTKPPIFADVNLTATVSSTASIGTSFNLSGSLTENATLSSDVKWDTSLDAITTYVIAAITADAKLGGVIASTTTITTALTADSLRNAKVDTSLSASATATGQNMLAAILATSTNVDIVDATSATEILAAVGNTSQIVTALTASAALRNARVDSDLAVTANPSSVVRWAAKFATDSVSVTADSTLVANYSTDLIAATMPGLPYMLPFRFGVVVNALTVAGLTAAFGADIAAGIVATGTSNINSAWVTDSTQTITANASAAVMRTQPIAATETTIAAGITATVAQNGKLSAQLQVSLDTNQDTLRNALVSANLTTASTSTASSLRNVSADSTQVIAANTSSVSNFNALISGDTSLTFSTTLALLRNARVDSSQSISAASTTTLNGSLKVASNSLAITNSQTSFATSSLVSAASLAASFTATMPMFVMQAIAADLDISAVAALTAGDILSALIVSNTVASATLSNTLNQASFIQASNAPVLPCILPFPLRGYTFLVSANRPSVATKTQYVATSLTVGATTSATLLLNRGVDASSSIAANLTATANYAPGTLAADTSITANISALAQASMKVVADQPIVASIDTLLNQYGNVESSLTVTDAPTSTMNQQGVLQSELIGVSESGGSTSLNQPIDASANGFFVFDASSLRDAIVQSDLTVFVGLPTLLNMDAHIDTSSVIVATVTAAAQVAYVGEALPVTLLAWVNGDLHLDAAANSETEISFVADTDDSNNRPLDSETNVSANILNELTRTQYIEAELEVVATPELSLIAEWNVSSVLEVAADRPIEIHRDVYCEASLEVAAVPDIVGTKTMYLEALEVTVTVTIVSPEDFKTIYIDSIDSPVIVGTEAKAEMYHPAGSFMPFFYAGGYAPAL